MTTDEVDLKCLLAFDDVWQTFDEAASDNGGINRRLFSRRILSLRKRGLLDSRRSDAHGRVEYAITPAGDAALAEAGLRS